MESNIVDAYSLEEKRKKRKKRKEKKNTHTHSACLSLFLPPISLQLS